MILVTGFEPFGGHAVNPSGTLARALGERADVLAEVLPVAWARAGARLRGLIEAERPEAVLALGLCASARMLRLERTAYNCDDTDAADNDGAERHAEPIRAGGPATYPSSLPLSELAHALVACGQPVEWSDDAGGFLCNHVFYVARDTLAALGRAQVPAGLIHVPPTDAVPLDAQRIALEACLERIRAAV